MADLIWVVLLAPLVGVIINGLILSRFGRSVRRKTSGVVATLGAAVAFGAAVTIAASLGSILNGKEWHDVYGYSWIEIPGSLTLPLALRIDPLSVTMMLVVTGVGTLIHLFSIGYMSEDERFGRFFTYLNLFLFSMLTLVLANNYVLMFVGWEGVGACSYLLIGFWFEKVSAAQAGKKAFLVNRVGDFGFILGLFILFWITGSLVYNTPEHTGALDQAHRLKEVQMGRYTAATVACLLLFLGACGKSAQLPLYLWLPDAMEGPTPVSALIHAATMVTAGVYLVARSSALFAQSAIAQSVVAWIGVATALYAAIIAIKQYDIKRVLAYSTVSQLGFMFVGVGVGAYAAGVSHLVTHAFFKALMFLGAGAVMHSLEGQLDMRKMGNMKKHMPVTFLTFAIGWYMICGLPFGSGFFSKDAILEGAYHHGFTAVFWIGVFVAGLTAFYMTRMFITVFLGSERIEMGDEGHGGDDHGHGHDHGHDHGHAHDHGHGHGHDHGHGVHVHPEQWVMNIPLIVLAILSIVGAFVVFYLPGFLHDVTLGAANASAAVHGAAADAAHGAAEAAHGAAGAAAHGAAEAAHGAAGEHGGKPGTWTWPHLTSMPTIVSSVFALAGVLAAWIGFGTEKFARGWSPSAEKMLGALQDAYEGFCHLVVVRGGTALSQALYSIVDRLMIDKLVDGVGSFVNYLAESLRTLQTGYVRNYALVMLAGAVFVVACFLIILQQQPVAK